MSDSILGSLVVIGLCLLLFVPALIQRNSEFQQAIEQGEIITGMNIDNAVELWGKPDLVCKAYQSPNWTWERNFDYWNYGAVYYEGRDTTLILSPVTFIVVAVLR